MNAVSVFICQHLNLNVPWIFHVAFYVDASVLESCGCFRRCRFQCFAQLVFTLNDAHTATAATGRGFHDHWKSNFPSQRQTFGFGSNRIRTSRQHRHPRGRHGRPRPDLIAHQADDFSGWSNKLNVAGGTNFREVRRLSQKSVARVNSVDVENLSRTDDRRNVQVTLSGRGWADTRGFIGVADMKRIPIDVAMNSDGFDAHLFTRPDDPASNLAPVCDQDLLKLSGFGRHPMSHVQCLMSNVQNPFSQTDFGHWTLDIGLFFDSEQRLTVFNRLAVLNINLNYFATRLSLDFIHQFHRFNDADHSVSLNGSSDLDERFRVWRR